MGEEVEREDYDDQEGDDQGLVVRHEIEGNGGVFDVLFEQGIGGPNHEQCSEWEGVQVWVQRTYFHSYKLFQGVNKIDESVNSPQAEHAQVREDLGLCVDGVEGDDLNNRYITL